MAFWHWSGGSSGQLKGLSGTVGVLYLENTTKTELAVGGRAVLLWVTPLGRTEKTASMWLPKTKAFTLSFLPA